MLILLAIYFLHFIDKMGSERVCLGPQAIEMREQRGIAIDEMDYEVSPVYLDSVRKMGAKMIHTSRWLNGATVEASQQVANKMRECSFVERVTLTRTTDNASSMSAVALQKNEITNTIASSDYTAQHTQLNLQKLHEAGYKGKGIRIGIADGGFYRADSMTALPHRQCLGYADFTDDAHGFFDATGNHGTLCLTAIAASKERSVHALGINDSYLGTATEAEYFLFRTEEHYTESPKEIDNWVAAIEMADSLGLHIVSTSLGYTTFDERQFDFAYSHMDGHTSHGAQAARIAARKGMLLVVAAGNDGNKAWHYISTPADADSILTVGAVNSSGGIAYFSSYGPTADGRVKPEVCAVGQQTVLLNPSTETPMTGNGTSFACPLIAGMAASLWSAIPYATNMEIRERIIRSADRYYHPHEQYGYGIPNIWQAYTMQTNTYIQPIIYVSTAEKILQNEQIYILNNGQKYDLLGNQIKD